MHRKRGAWEDSLETAQESLKEPQLGANPLPTAGGGRVDQTKVGKGPGGGLFRPRQQGGQSSCAGLPDSELHQPHFRHRKPVRLQSHLTIRYLFFKIVDLQLLEAIDGILDCVLRDSDSLNNFSELVNKCVSSRNLQILSLKVSKPYKEELKNRLSLMQQQGVALSDSGK